MSRHMSHAMRMPVNAPEKSSSTSSTCEFRPLMSCIVSSVSATSSEAKAQFDAV